MESKMNSIKVDQHALNAALVTVGRAVASRTTIPILRNVLISKVSDSEIRVVATNLNIEVVTRIEAEVNGDFSCTFPAGTFMDMVSSLRGKIELTQVKKSGAIKITADGAESSLVGMDSDDFPLPDSIDYREGGITLSASKLNDAIRRVEFSVVEEEARQIHNSVLIEFNGNAVSLVTTDGSRLSLSMIMGERRESKSFMVPVAAMRELSRLISLIKPDDVTMFVPVSRYGMAVNQLIFDCGSTRFITQLVSGEYPHYAAIIPTESKIYAIFQREDILNAFNRAMIIGREGDKVGELTFMKNSLKIYCESQKTGDIRTVVNGNITGGDLIVLMDISFMTEVMKVIRSKEVVIECTTNMRPVMVRGNGPEDQGYLYIQMPVKRG